MVDCWKRKGKAAGGDDERAKAFIIIYENGRQKKRDQTISCKVQKQIQATKSIQVSGNCWQGCM